MITYTPSFVQVKEKKKNRIYCAILCLHYNYFVLELFERDIAEAGPAELYFEDSFDLVQVFRAMETQNLNALIHLDSLVGPMADVTTTIVVTEARINQEVSEISSTIDNLKVR